MWGTNKDNLEMVELLLANNADPNVNDKVYYAVLPLHCILLAPTILNFYIGQPVVTVDASHSTGQSEDGKITS